MNSEQLAELARLIAAESMLTNWQFFAIFLLLVVIGAAVGAFLQSYFGKRGELSATQGQFNTILRQLEQTIRLTEEVRSAVSFQEWSARDRRELRRRKLEELCLAAHEVSEWLTHYRNDELFKPYVSSPATYSQPLGQSPIARMSVVGRLYFPELRVQVAAVNLAYAQQMTLISTTKVNALQAESENLAAGNPRLGPNVITIVRNFKDELEPLLRRLIESVATLESAAQTLMEQIAPTAD